MHSSLFPPVVTSFTMTESNKVTCACGKARQGVVNTSVAHQPLRPRRSERGDFAAKETVQFLHESRKILRVTAVSNHPDDEQRMSPSLTFLLVLILAFLSRYVRTVPAGE